MIKQGSLFHYSLHVSHSFKLSLLYNYVQYSDIISGLRSLTFILIETHHYWAFDSFILQRIKGLSKLHYKTVLIIGCHESNYYRVFTTKQPQNTPGDLGNWVSR